VTTPKQETLPGSTGGVISGEMISLKSFWFKHDRTHVTVFCWQTRNLLWSVWSMMFLFEMAMLACKIAVAATKSAY
jgi:hypothetical protein